MKQGYYSSVLLALCVVIPVSRVTAQETALTPGKTKQAAMLARDYLLSHQTPEGRFHYEVHAVSGQISSQDGEVRQAGALWGLALGHRWQPSEASAAGVRRGLDFFIAHSRSTPDKQASFVVYPQAPQGSTGTTALASLALTEWIRAQANGVAEQDQRQLQQWIEFIRRQRRHDERFHQHYEVVSGEPWDLPSPYFDGEALLALVKATRYTSVRSDPQRLVATGRRMHDVYVSQARRENPDSPETKGFFQWGIMAYFEMFDAQWDQTQELADHAIEMASWMVDVHKVEERPGNTAYALEGMILAAELARRRGQHETARRLDEVSQRVLSKLLSWQVQGPYWRPAMLPPGLPDDASTARSARGGVLTGAGLPWLRVDVTQHQLHATVLALEYLVPESR